ncbi:hypothetical protein FACS1894199_00610 [Bacteroidia bacterium]|nr:hypothetical protein FACS1894199_00610 [Bacteroidia bacterium]
MNYKFEISLPETSDFRMEIAIRGEQTFLQLHDKIIETLGWDDAQVTSFFTIDKEGERGKEITLMDMSAGELNSDSLVMENTKIEDVINANCIELDYVYDFLSEKYMRVEYAGEYRDDSASNLPHCLSIIGETPVMEEDMWALPDVDEDEKYDDSFMDEFSAFSDDKKEHGYDDEDDEDEYDEYNGGGGYDDDNFESIDDYLDKL